MQKIVFEDTEVTKQPYVEINNIEYEVQDGTYVGGTDLDADTFNTMQDNIEDAIKEVQNVELIAISDVEPSECTTGDKYYNTEDNLIYTAIATDTWSEDGEQPIKGIFYILFSEQSSYSYDGTTLVSVGGGTEDIVISDEEPTEEGVKIWIDTGEISNRASEITNSYSTSTGIGYSANYVNSITGFDLSGYTLLDNSIYYKKCGKMVTLYRPARTTTNSYIQNEISLAEYNYTNLNASNKLLPAELRPSARIGFAVFAHTTGNENLNRCYGEVEENGYIAIYNWGSATTLNRLAFCVTYMVD